MEEPIKEYKHQPSSIIIINKILLSLFVIGYIWLGFYPPENTPKYFSIIGRVLSIPTLLILIYLFLTDYSYKKRCKIIQIYKNKVILIIPFLNNFKLTLTKKDVNSVFKKNVCGTPMVWIKLKNPKSYVKKNSLVNPPYDFIYSLVHYIIFKLHKIPIKFSQFEFKSKEDAKYINRNILKINTKKGGHLFFPKTYYHRNFDSIFKDLKKTLQ
ncbi:hypothetical protein HYW20_08835 [Candidatus Woesearchaeota archaeon]|nr:hypothetical protein [Candidatus Woesearchaeota archaeon]